MMLPEKWRFLIKKLFGTFFHEYPCLFTVYDFQRWCRISNIHRKSKNADQHLRCNYVMVTSLN